MNDIYYLYDRNRIVEEHLHCIDIVIRQNWALMKAARLDYDDVYAGFGTVFTARPAMTST